MKKHIVIPVSYKEQFFKDVGWADKEVNVAGFNNKKNADYLEDLSGSLALEVLLDAGWTILSVQTAQIPANASDNSIYQIKGGVMFHYILESPEID